MLGQTARAGTSGQDSLVVSVITCAPGPEIYELCGHEAIRIRGVRQGVPIDNVWNYGLFDFNQPNFIYRFVKGETDYQVGGYPFSLFMPEYINSDREVREQDIDLTSEEANDLLNRLSEASLPQNCRYRYNYVKNNCATKIRDILDSVSGQRIVYPDSVKYGTYRKEMRYYHKNYPWYQFGIDLALGSGLDIPISGRKEMFVPVEMSEKLENAKFADGRKVVLDSRILFNPQKPAVDPPTPWWVSPIFISLIFFGIMGAVAFWEWKKTKLFRWIYTFWFGICGLAGCLVCFLVFVSEHEATSPNLLLVWLNPFQLLFAICIWSRRLRIISQIMSWYNIIGVGCLLLVWYFQNQSANIAFFPLMGVSVVLSMAYSAVNQENIRDNNDKKSIYAVDRGGGAKRSHRSGNRQGGVRTKAGGGNRR